MKEKIHPQYFKNATQRCACGAVFHIPSTKKEVEVEICSQCHPFYTGKAKIVDVAGQVEKFKKRVAKTRKIREKPPKKAKVVKAIKKVKAPKKSKPH
ncbi:MAG: 50S ribosomal protein L31 [Parcubacteria group bacterium CG_4_9_14_0_2_um_filter_35_11]|nr:MAG: 50S ribosomal protein L31 [Parcubacteria group bacterium CG_4_9_14_0_2_um_filter_35_11]